MLQLKGSFGFAKTEPMFTAPPQKNVLHTETYLTYSREKHIRLEDYTNGLHF